MLNIIPINSSHRAELIISKLSQLFEEFNISQNILAMITDNRSNMIACGNQLAAELDQEFNNMSLFIFDMLLILST